MPTYTITAEQKALLDSIRLQLLDSPHKNDHAAAALLNWVETLQPAPATSLSGNKTLASDHQGMRVNYSGLLGQCQRALALGEGSHSALAEMLRQLQGHLQELGRRWYAGDVAVVDELLQLYCVEAEARAALKDAQPAASAPEPVTLTDEREAFEAHESASDLARDEDCPEDYRNTHVQSAWDGWRARAALAASQPAPSTTREFTNELGNAIKITIEGPTSTSENVLTPMEVKELLSSLVTHHSQSAPVEAQAVPTGSPDWSAIGFATPTPSKGEA